MYSVIVRDDVSERLISWCIVTEWKIRRHFRDGQISTLYTTFQEKVLYEKTDLTVTGDKNDQLNFKAYYPWYQSSGKYLKICNYCNY